MVTDSKITAFILKSPDFKGQDIIPDKFTCSGENISPKLVWEDAPQGTKSFALIVDDPDAHASTPFVHWVAYNIPADQTRLEENVSNKREFKNGMLQGFNDFNVIGYKGPCPPKGHGVHHYHFKLYAIDYILDLSPGALKVDVLNAIDGHVLSKAEFEGLYSRY